MNQMSSSTATGGLLSGQTGPNYNIDLIGMSSGARPTGGPMMPGYRAMNPGMNPSMNTGMSPGMINMGMSPGMNPGMMNSSMNPSMNMRMNPGMGMMNPGMMGSSYGMGGYGGYSMNPQYMSGGTYLQK